MGGLCQDLGEVSEPVAPTDHDVALLFTDIEASSAWWERDPAAMRAALELHDRLLRDVATNDGGVVFTARGDGFGISFDTVDAAARVAAEAQRALASAPWPAPVRLDVRMGIHVGSVERRDNNLFGAAVNRAARIMDAGHGGQVLLSGTAAERMTSEVELADLGTFRLRGLSDLERIWWLPVPGARHEEFPPLRLRSAGASRSHPVPTRLRFEGDTTFVGRQHAVTQLVDAWRSARDGGSPVVLVGGEAGIGKTRLIAEVASQVHDAGGAVLYGRCDPHGGTPLQPFDEAFAGVSANGVALTADADGDGVTRHAVVDALARVGEECDGAVLVVDDLHWADASTATLLEQLVVSVAPPATAIVVAYRPSDVVADGHVDETLGALRRRIGANALQLDGLTLDEVEQLVAAAAGHELGALASVVAELHETTNGNALFVRELIRHLVATEAATFDGERWSVAPLDSIGIPHGVREVVHQRLDALPTATREVLTAAAVFGQEFDVRHLAALRSAAVEEVVSHLDPAVTAGLVQEVSATRLAFGHLLVQRAVYDGIARGERIGLHVGAARSIESSPDATRHRAELAHHWGEAAHAGHAEEAVRACVQAGEASTASAAYDSAVDHHRRALVLASELLAEPGRALDLRLDLANALNLAGRLDEARDEFVAAATEARAASSHDRLARAALGIGGDLPSTPPVDEVAIRLLEEALAHHEPPTATRALLLSRLAERRHRVDAAVVRSAWSDEAVQIADALGDDPLRASVLLSRVRTRHGPDSMREMLSISEEVDRIALDPPDDSLAIRSAQVRMTAAFTLGDLDSAENAVRVISVLAQRLRQPEYDRLPLMWDAFRATSEGRFDDARATITELNAVLDVGRHSQTTSMVGALVMMEMIFRGRADANYQVMLEIDVPYRDALLAWFAAESGQFDRAREHLGRCTVADIEADRNWSWWQAMVSLTSAASLCGDRSILAETRAAMTPWADQQATAGHVTYLGCGHHHVGVAARELGDLDDAVEHLGLALEAHGAIGALPFLAWTQVELASTLATRRAPGDSARATELRTEALQTATRLRLESVLRRA